MAGSVPNGASGREPKEEIHVMFWYGHDLSAWGWVGMTVGMIAFWGLVIALIVWLVRDTQRTVTTTQPPDPQQVLAERFARGEIEEAEYEGRLATLRGTRAPAVRS